MEKQIKPMIKEAIAKPKNDFILYYLLICKLINGLGYGQWRFNMINFSLAIICVKRQNCG
jgi:hypothetical protein